MGGAPLSSAAARGADQAATDGAAAGTRDAVGATPLSSAAARGDDRAADDGVAAGVRDAVGAAPPRAAAVPSSEVVSSEAGESPSVAIPLDGVLFVIAIAQEGGRRRAMAGSPTSRPTTALH
jgi:hypothetical protein